MTDRERLEKIKKLADAMYYAAQQLTTDASRLHKAMEEYHQFIINEYHKKEPTIPDIVDEHFYEMLGEKPINNGLNLGCGVIWKDEEPVSDFTKALAECIHQAQCAVVDPMAHAEIWKDELIKLTKSKEPVNENLEQAIDTYLATYFGGEKEKQEWPFLKKMAIYFANWQKEKLWKPADGDDLPIIDREVIALLDNGKVVFAHRPPEYWDGKDIVTGKVTRIYPKTYDKGEWNIPNIKYWLDVKLPKEIEL